LDVESAYRIIPVHPEDRLLLGMSWRGKIYVDTALPLGLRSAPKIVSAVADALQWALEGRGVKVIHYLDDFLLFGAPESQECKQALQTTLDMCSKLGVPIAAQKTVGPAEALVFLGIEIDTRAQEIRLPSDKLTRLQREIRNWRERHSCTKRDLLSLIGQLQHACCVVRPGRTFLRRMISLSCVASELHHHIRLNRGFRSDLQWWAQFLPTWNGTSMMTATVRSPPAAVITTDASGSWGCGGFSSLGHWFQLQWPESWKELHITVKVFSPVVLGVTLWGKQWCGTCIRCNCDNAAVVAILNSGSSKNERVMHFMRSLFFILARYNMIISAMHVPGVENGAADALSRNNLSSFLSQVPFAQKEATQIPQELHQSLILSQPDWISINWTQLFTSTL